MSNDPSGQPETLPLPAFLQERPFDLAHPGRRELRDILYSQYYDKPTILALLSKTGLMPGWYTLDVSADQIWRDILTKTAGRARLPELLGAVLSDEEAATWHPRLRELLAEKPVLPATSKAKLDWAPEKGSERLIGPRSTLLGIAFLATGLARSPAVVRITARFGDDSTVGSGFLIAREHILTNHHVLFDADGNPPTSVEIWFGYELAPDGSRAKVDIYTGDVEAIRADRADDWAVIPLREPLRKPCTPITLAEPSRPVEVGDRVYIIQHPSGGYKQISLHENIVTSRDPHRIQYLTDTEGGSSGSPVFNDHWELVALHHQWVDVAIKGSLKPEYRNQGVNIARVVKALPDLAGPTG